MYRNHWGLKIARRVVYAVLFLSFFYVMPCVLFAVIWSRRFMTLSAASHLHATDIKIAVLTTGDGVFSTWKIS